MGQVYVVYYVKGVKIDLTFPLKAFVFKIQSFEAFTKHLL